MRGAHADCYRLLEIGPVGTVRRPLRAIGFRGHLRQPGDGNSKVSRAGLGPARGQESAGSLQGRPRTPGKASSPLGGRRAAPRAAAPRAPDPVSFQLWIGRVAAASQEHGLKYPALVGSLVKCQVELNRKVLADLAIYEPKTFKSLAALAKRRREEGFAAALGDGQEPAGVFSRVVQYR
ncbi:PREDICTED: 39S ribosomal protein L20, mitochondrial [Condylura cristata]|uniref:39S ribosomal protein L20, mitochondrial n=1 Tax=Condylura cristata TaxID=143302 RepID=UPI000643581B|nr:PREDICTED: 39S ribosomal protein L20, mitochondrial [Condylura cristata]